MKYKMHGTVPSGKNNTTEGNSKRMSYYFRYAVHLHNRDHPNDQLIHKVHYYGKHKGDDVIWFVSRGKVEILRKALYRVFTD